MAYSYYDDIIIDGDFIGYYEWSNGHLIDNNHYRVICTLYNDTYLTNSQFVQICILEDKFYVIDFNTEQILYNTNITKSNIDVINYSNSENDEWSIGMAFYKNEIEFGEYKLFENWLTK